MYQQAVYQLVTNGGTTPTAGYRRLVGLSIPADFPYRQMAMQWPPLMPIGNPAAMAPEKNPREYRVWAFLQISAIKTLDRSFLQKLPLAQVGEPAATIRSRQLPDSRFFGPSWNSAFYQRPALIAIPAPIPPAALVPIRPTYPPFFAATWNMAFYQRRALSVIADSIAVITGGGMFHNVRPFTWTPIKTRWPWLLPLDEEELINSLGLAVLADAEEKDGSTWQ